MGCTPPKKSKDPLKRVDTLLGSLKLTVLDAVFSEQLNVSHPILKCRINNQQYLTNQATKTGDHIPFNESFRYYINSFYQAEGRVLEIELQDGTSQKAFGSVDISHLINRNQEEDGFRVVLNTEKDKCGYVNVRTIFNQQTATPLTFSFDNVTIKRKTSTFGDPKILTRVTIGEQILQTTLEEDTKDKFPEWKDQYLHFMVPKSVKTGLIELIDDSQEVVGGVQVDLQTYLNRKHGQQIMVHEQLRYKEGIAASLKYRYVVGNHPSFSNYKDIMNSSIHHIIQ